MIQILLTQILTKIVLAQILLARVEIVAAIVEFPQQLASREGRGKIFTAVVAVGFVVTVIFVFVVTVIVVVIDVVFRGVCGAACSDTSGYRNSCRAQLRIGR